LSSSRTAGPFESGWDGGWGGEVQLEDNSHSMSRLMSGINMLVSKERICWWDDGDIVGAANFASFILLSTSLGVQGWKK
jgi:hypothetical protein